MYHYVTNLAMNLNTDAFELTPLEITIGVPDYYMKADILNKKSNVLSSINHKKLYHVEVFISVEDIRKKKNRDYIRKYQAQKKQSLKNQQPDTFMTTKSESHTSANKKVGSSRLKHLHVTVQESSRKPSANDTELSTSNDQNRKSSEII